MPIKIVSGIRTSFAENLGYNFSCKNTKSAPVSSDVLRPFGAGVAVSFTGNPNKNKKQLVSITAEYGQLLGNVYDAGGVGVVANEAGHAMYKKGVDIRTVVPYYSADNKNGKIKVRVQQADNMYSFKEVELDYKLQPNEVFVTHKKPIPGKENQTDYKILDKTGIKGVAKSIRADLGGVEELPYEVFTFRDTGKNNPLVYCVHLSSMANFERCYAPNQEILEDYKKRSFRHVDYSNFDRAVVDALPKLNEEEFGDFNPASIWLHEAHAFPFMLDAAEKSAGGDEYYRGIKTHLTHHNAGRDYQGHYRCAIDFFRIAGSEEDLKWLKTHPEYKFVTDMAKKLIVSREKNANTAVEQILSEKEMKKLDEIFAPLFGDFIDETGEYNMSKISLNAAKLNPKNVTAGTVSDYYGVEIRSFETADCAKGLTKSFSELPANDVLNGSSPANLNLDKIGDFGKGNLNNPEIKQNFTPLNFKYDNEHILQNQDEIYEAKLSNKKWLINSIAKAANAGKKDLHDLFFDATDTNTTVLGELSEYKEGDQLIIGWGRANPQKGFPVTLEAYLQFFKDENIDESLKLKTKVLLGAGPWYTERQDWKDIERLMSEIAKLNDGKYAKNVCYVNGYFPNRFVACADFVHITSRFEPCGITPLEAFAAGTPVISNRTGGSPDLIIPYNGENADCATGFLTEHAYLINPEILGVPKNITDEELDNARRIKLGAENAVCIKTAMTMATAEVNNYKKMLGNVASIETDWHNNHKLNNGISSIDKYLKNIWAIDSLEANNTAPLKSLKRLRLSA